MPDQMFMTPPVVVDGSELAFVGAIEPGREAEAFATLLTFATFSEKTEEVLDEAYSIECARTGTASRLSEERWYQVAKEYFDEFVEHVRTELQRRGGQHHGGDQPNAQQRVRSIS